MDRFSSVIVNKNSHIYQFKLLGHRNYVHGSSMLICLLDAIQSLKPGALEKQAHIKQFKIIKEFHTNAKAIVMPISEAPSSVYLKDAVARLDLKTEFGEFTSLLLPLADEIVSNRISTYDSKDYVNSAESFDNGKAVAWLKNIYNYIDFLRGIIEANVQLTTCEMSQSGKISKIRWAYIMDFPFFNSTDVVKHKKIYLTKKTEVRKGNRIFQVKSISFDGLNDTFTPELAFFIELAQ
ncbi:hypothetical protein ACFLZL_04735 [Thermodesulfobacteriota bacterium]